MPSPHCRASRKALANGTPFSALGLEGRCSQSPIRSKIRQYGAHSLGDLRREGVDLTGPSVIARRARAGHDAQTLDHEPTAYVLALRADDGERSTGVWQGEALSLFTSRGGDSQAEMTLSAVVGGQIGPTTNAANSWTATPRAPSAFESQVG